jgi:hypothetical protein
VAALGIAMFVQLILQSSLEGQDRDSATQFINDATNSQVNVQSMSPETTSLPTATQRVAQAIETVAIAPFTLPDQRPAAPYNPVGNYNARLTEQRALSDADHPVPVMRHHIIPDSLLRRFWNRLVDTGDISNPVVRDGFLQAIQTMVRQGAYDMTLPIADREHVVTLLEALRFPASYETNPDFDVANARDSFAQVFEWLPGNLFIGPMGGGGNWQRTDDPGDFFEVNAGTIVNSALNDANAFALWSQAFDQITTYTNYAGPADTESAALGPASRALADIARRRSAPFDLNPDNWVLGRSTNNSNTYSIRRPT